MIMHVKFKPGRGGDASAKDWFTEILGDQFETFKAGYDQLTDDQKTRIKGVLDTDDDVFSDQIIAQEHLTEIDNLDTDEFEERKTRIEEILAE